MAKKSTFRFVHGEIPVGIPESAVAANREALLRMFGKIKESQNANVYGGFLNVYERKSDSSAPQFFACKRANTIQNLLRFTFDPQFSYYITRNPFRKKDTHVAGNLYSFRLITVDIDAHTLSTKEANHLSWLATEKLITEIDAGAFEGIEPNVVVSTGRGLQISWSLFPLYASKAQNKATYRKIAKNLCSIMKQWLADHPQFSALSVDSGASCSPAGLIRLPGSCHPLVTRQMGTTLAYVQAFLPQKETRHNAILLDKRTSELLGSKVRIFAQIQQIRLDSQEKTVVDVPEQPKEQLADAIAKQSDSKKKAKDSTKANSASARSSKSAENDETAPFDIYNADGELAPAPAAPSYQWLKQRYYRIYDLVKDTYPNGVPNGIRDLTLFVLGNLAIKFIVSEEKTEKLLLELNQELCAVPLKDKEVIGYFSSSRKKRGKDGTKGYRISDNYIKSNLALNLQESRPTLDFKAIEAIRARRREHSAEILAERQQEREKVWQKAADLYKQNWSYAKIAAFFGKSKSTVCRWIQAVTQAKETVIKVVKKTVKKAFVRPMEAYVTEANAAEKSITPAVPSAPTPISTGCRPSRTSAKTHCTPQKKPFVNRKTNLLDIIFQQLPDEYWADLLKCTG